MSPKFALAVLLLSCVLLGIANGQQRYQQRQQYNRQKVGTRNMPPADNGGSPDMGPQPSGGGSDGGAFNPECQPNQLASHTPDTRTPRPKPKHQIGTKQI